MTSDPQADDWLSQRAAADLIGCSSAHMASFDLELYPLKIVLGNGTRYGRSYLRSRVVAFVALRADSARAQAAAESAVADARCASTRKPRKKESK